MLVKVKICGIRTIDAAIAAVDAGADFLGFNFVSTSPRYIDPMKALEIIDLVKNKIKTVGIFQNADINFVNKIAKELKLDFVQLHDNKDGAHIIQIENTKSVAYFLIDRPQRKGKMVDFKKAAQVATKLKLFYAGGLTPENVVNVVKEVRPFAVDVAGGIETNGQQDLKKIKQFVKNAKGATL